MAGVSGRREARRGKSLQEVGLPYGPKVLVGEARPEDGVTAAAEQVTVRASGSMRRQAEESSRLGVLDD